MSWSPRTTRCLVESSKVGCAPFSPVLQRPARRRPQGLIRAREELRFQATHAVLTGIWNRRALLDLLQRELERASRNHSSTALLMLDLDHFKEVNDKYGHLAGDAVLREVARRVMQVIRSYDFVGRYGGEEFLVVLPACDRIHAFQSAEGSAPLGPPKFVKSSFSPSPTQLSIRPRAQAAIAPRFSDRQAYSEPELVSWM